MKQISIPSSVKSIGEYAFFACTSLKNVLFENPSQLTSIGNHAFDKCSSMDHLDIPSTVTYIGEDAFPQSNCSIF